MANLTVDNGALTDFVVATKALSGGIQIQQLELVTAVEGGAAADLAKAEDSAHVSGHFGIMALGVRKDSAVAIADADGDYTPFLTDDSGRLHVIVGAIPATDRTSDSVSAALASDKVMLDQTALTPKFASGTFAASTTDGVVVAAVTSKIIRVVAIAFACGASATTITLESGGTTRIHKQAMGANGGMVLPFNPVGWFQSVVGENIAATTSAGSATEISVVYVEV